VTRHIVFTPKAAKPPRAHFQAVKAAGLVFVSGTASADLATNPPARQAAELPVHIPGLKRSIACIAEA
jgi:enamine deaminase RidA (YjgF/YER057c/UK114 family)